MKEKLRVLLGKICQVLVAGLIFTMPWQTRLIVETKYSFMYGLFEEYLSMFVYLTDILFALLLIAYGLHLWINKPKVRLWPRYFFYGMSIFILTLLVDTGFSVLPTISLYGVWRWVEALMFLYLLYQRVLPLTQQLYVLLSSVVLQGLIGLAQVLLQSDLGLRWLGEYPLSTTMPGVASTHVGGLEILRAYGTLPHPNILAAYILVAFWCVMLLKKIPKNRSRALKIFLLISLLLTQSLAGILTLAVSYLVFWSFKKYGTNKKKRKQWSYLIMIALAGLLIVSVLLPNVAVPSKFIHDRLLYLSAGRQLLWSPRLLLGYGVHTFTYLLQRFPAMFHYPWDYQPVHNIYLLLLVEGGVLALASYLYLYYYLLRGLLKRFVKKNSRSLRVKIALLCSIFLLGLADHYLITNQEGLLLWSFSMSLLL